MLCDTIKQQCSAKDYVYSFPGGVRDAGDATPIATALRETEEELGISPSNVEVWGRLPAIPTSNRFSLVTPVLGRLSNLDLRSLTVNPAEVRHPVAMCST